MRDNRWGIISLIWRSIVRLFSDQTLPLAGNIAFRSLFSVFPFLIFLTALAGFVGNEGLAEKVVSYLMSVAPQELAKPLEPEIRNILTVPRSGQLSLAAFLTVWSAMTGVDAVRMALNRAYSLKETRNVGFLFVQNLVFIVITAIVLLIIALMIVFVPIAIIAADKYAPDLVPGLTTFNSLRYPIAITVLFIGLLLCHRILPCARFTTREVLPGILLTISSLMILSSIFSYYLSHFNSFTTTYSSLSGVFAIMFFLYLSALLLIIGGEFNKVIMLLKENRGNISSKS